MIRALLALALLTLATPLAARPLAYALDQSRSEVGFRITMGQQPLKGTMPVTRADLSLDFDHAAASRVSVTLSPAAARMGLPFATEAMKSPTVLDTARFPDIRFESTRVRALPDGASVEGRITIRGVTRPVTLTARLFRPPGTAKGARDALTIRLTGRVRRGDFGATGFADLVGDEVRLDITAHIRLTAGN